MLDGIERNWHRRKRIVSATMDVAMCEADVAANMRQKCKMRAMELACGKLAGWNWCGCERWIRGCGVVLGAKGVEYGSECSERAKKWKYLNEFYIFSCEVKKKVVTLRGFCGSVRGRMGGHVGRACAEECGGTAPNARNQTWQAKGFKGFKAIKQGNPKDSKQSIKAIKTIKST